MNDQKRVEAVLFAVGKEITVDRIASLCTLETEQVTGILSSLQESYAKKDHSLQIVKRDSGWKLTIRDEYVPLVSSIVSSMELERPLMETLAVIAWKYPVVQSEIVKLRGSSAYEHMRELVAQGYVAKERFGRTYKVKLTKKFFNYFDLPSEQAKQAFLSQVPKEILENAEHVDKETDEVERLVELNQKEKEARKEIEAAMAGAQEDVSHSFNESSDEPSSE